LPAVAAKLLQANVTDVRDLLSGPGRVRRPKRVAVVLRGLPGSGKSLVAQRLREAEAAAGDATPRVHSIDDYFVTVSGFAFYILLCMLCWRVLCTALFCSVPFSSDAARPSSCSALLWCTLMRPPL
jgi:Mrp family chromosome partitioning ATPase